MTAFASAILAALPGAGVQPEKAGTNGASGGEGVLGVFEALLAGLTDGDAAALGAGLLGDGAADDGKAAATDAATGEAVVDPALAAAAAVVLPFAPLTAVLPTSSEDTVDAAPPTEGMGAKTSTAPAAAAVVDTAVETALPFTGEQAEAATTPRTTAASAADATATARDAAAITPEAPAARTAAAAEPAPSATGSVRIETATAILKPTSETPGDIDLPPPVTDAPRTPAAAAAAAAPAVTATVQAMAQPVEAPKPAAAAKSAAVSAPAPTVTTTASTAAPQAAPATDAVATAAAAVAAAGAAETEVEAAPVAAAAVVAPRPAAPAGESRRAAGATTAKTDQTTSAVAAYLDGLDGAAKTETEVAPDAVAGLDDQADAIADFAPAPVDVAETDEPRAQAPAADVRAAAAQTAAHDAAAPAASRASAETVAKLSADIVRKLDGQSTRFDLQLDPHGMGKVDVSIEIDRDGRLTAALSFDSAQAASDLKGRSAELRNALEQAGFEVADSALSFDFNGQQGGFQGREAGEQQRAWSGRAFQTAQVGLDEADARAALSSRSRAASGGVDIRI